ncbi:MAG: hypothetical protein J0H00_22540 [Burkholderiales bacterium]|nr:hypothetical protein [Burkholderiales bacterium]
MTVSAHALISLEERFAEGILNGEKLVELRRRPMRLNIGATVWMYVKVPVGEVIGSAQVRSLHTLTPQTLWRKYGNVSGLSRTEFFDYLSGVEHGFVLVLDSPVRLKNPVPLERLRILNNGFQPPQFFQHLANDGALVTAFSGNVTVRAPTTRSMTSRQQTCIVAA